MNRCEAPNCKMRTYAPTVEQVKLAKNNYVISFHKFPDDSEKRQSWISAANKPSWRPPLFNSSLCSLHFRDDCFNDNNELYDHAVPTIFFDDFGNYMRELVKKLDLQCKLDDDDASKTSKESENATNSSIESNQSCIPPGSDGDVSFVECEEVVVYEENSKLGIENISIPELDDSASVTVANNIGKPPAPVSKLATSMIDSNELVDIKIYNPTNENQIEKISISAPCGSAEICILEIDACSNLTANVASSSSLPKSTSIDSSTVTETNLTTSTVSKPSLPLTSVKSIGQQSKIAFHSQIKSTVLSNKPTSLPAAFPRPSIPSSKATNLPLSSSNSSPSIKPIVMQPPGISVSRPTLPASTLTNAQTKSTFTASQSGKPITNASSISQVGGVKTTSSTTPGTSKPTTSTVPTSNSLTSRGKNTSGEKSSFSVMEPTAKSLVMQLMNIVKMANITDEKKNRTSSIVNCYLITSKCIEADSSELREKMQSSSIIATVADYVKAIKEETFVKPKNVTIICGSPAIFLWKNITVQDCDSNMNCVYVITTENLLPHLHKMKLKSGMSDNSQYTSVQKPLQVSDLVSSASPNDVLSLRNPQVLLPPRNLPSASNNATKMNTVPKLSSVSNPAKHPKNFTSCPSPARPPANSISNPNVATPTTNDSISCSSVNKTPSNNSFSYSSGVKPQATNLFSYSNSIEPPACTRISNVAVAKSQANSSNVNAFIAKSTINSSNVKVDLTRPPVNPSITTAAPARPQANNSNSGPRVVFNKPVSVPSTNPTIVSRTTTHNTVSKTQTYTKTGTIASPVMKTPLPITSVSRTLASIPDLPPSRVPSSICNTPSIQKSPALTKTLGKTDSQLINLNVYQPTTDSLLSRALYATTGTPSAAKSLALTKTAARIDAQPVSVNVYPKSQPSVYIINSSRPVVQPQNLPLRVSTTPAPAKPPVPSDSIVYPSSAILSANKSKQPSLAQTTITKSNSLLNSIPAKPRPSTSTADSAAFIFKPIQPSSFDTNLKTSELLVTYDSFGPSTSTSTIPSQSTVKIPLKRKWGEMDDDDDEDDDDDDDPFFAPCNDENYDKEYLEQQRIEIENCESNILQKEREINNLKKKVQTLKKRLNCVRNPNDTKTDEQLIEEILSKYMDSDGVQFFIGQMKVAGKTYTQFRWSEDDKLFALGLLYKNPVEYNVLFQKYTLPSDKTLNKFVNRVKKAEMQDTRSTNGK